jgi:curved DNA-binding protein CbpA
MDYYELLGVNRSASDAEIKRAYRRLSFQYHPDKNSSLEAEELFKEINAAYDVLGDPEKRRAYDLRGAFQFDVEPEAMQPQHRDPRYRRRPAQPSQGVKSTKYTPQEVMAICLKYLVWVNRVALLVTLVYAIDYFIPYDTRKETVSSYNAVYRNSGRYKETFFLLTTQEGSTIKVSDPEDHFFETGQLIVLEKTRIYSTTMSVGSEGDLNPVIMGTIYRGPALFPVGALLASIGALVFRKQLNLAFNLSITSAFLLFITLLMIFFL